MAAVHAPAAALPPSPRPTDLLGAGGMLASVVAALGTMGLVPLGPWPQAVVPVVVGVAALAVLAAARHTQPEGRRAWRLVGAGVLGQGISLAGRALGAGGAVLPAAELTGVAAMGVMAAGIVTLPHLPVSRFGLYRLVLDVAAGTVAFAVLSWELWPPEGTQGAARWTMAAALFGALLLAALRPSIHRLDGRVALVGIAAAAVIAAETVAASRPEIRLTASTALFGLALLLPRPAARRRMAPARWDLWRQALPYSVVAVMFVLVFARLVERGGSDLGLLPWGVIAVAAITVGRQAVALEEARERAAGERDRLLASLTHELRGPLTAVAGFAGVLSDDWEVLPEAERRDMIGIVAVQASHLAHLVTDVGLLARDELDTVDLRLERIEGRRLVADSIRAVFDVASGDLPVKAVVEPYLELVGDRARLIQLLAALLVNAHRHGSHILVMITRGDGSRSIEVHDDGPGVPAGFEQVMWERFERHGEGAPNRSGLGLALVRGIARAHGGKAGHRRSERLGGACFTVELPYTDHPAPREGAAAGAE